MDSSELVFLRCMRQNSDWMLVAQNPFAESNVKVMQWWASHSSFSLVDICTIIVTTITTTILIIITTCHSSVSLVMLPVDVVDSGPDPGGRELVGGRELEMLFLCLKIFGFGFLGTCIPSWATQTLFPRASPSSRGCLCGGRRRRTPHIEAFCPSCPCCSCQAITLSEISCSFSLSAQYCSLCFLK